MNWWSWLLFGLLLVLSEVLTPGAFYLLFFGLSACLLSIALGVGIPISLEIQWVLFSAISIVLIAALRPFIVRGSPTDPPSRNDRDSPVGETAITVAGIPAGGQGHVDFRGAQWAARNVSALPIQAHARVQVLAVDGLTLEVTSEK